MNLKSLIFYEFTNYQIYKRLDRSIFICNIYIDCRTFYSYQCCIHTPEIYWHKSW